MQASLHQAPAYSELLYKSKPKQYPIALMMSPQFLDVCVVPNYPTYKELTEEVQSPTAISLGLGEEGKPLRARCYNCGQIGHISYDCKFPQVRKACYTCGNQGHLSRDWYSWNILSFHHNIVCSPQKKKVLVCYACRQVGHITVDCPNRSKNRPVDNGDPMAASRA